MAHRGPVLRPAAARPTWPRSCGRDAAAVARRPREARLGGGRDRLAAADRAATTSTWSTSARRATRHAEIAIAALDAGKHVLCEKPLANTVAEAEAMVGRRRARPRARGARSMVGFNYRRVPAVALARQLVAEGRLGHDPARPRAVPAGLDRRPGVPAGRGGCRQEQGRVRRAGRHRRAHHRPGPVRHRRAASPGVSALTETFVKERPLPAASSRPVRRRAARERGPVTVDDAALFLGRFAGGALGIFEATRFATGRKNALRLEVNGSRGSLAFDFEAMNEL